VQDTVTITTEDEYELVCDLSSGAKCCQSDLY